MLLGKAVFILGLLLQIAIRYPYRKGRKQQKDRQEQVLLLLLTLGGLLLPFIYIFTNWLAFADYHPPQWVMAASHPVPIGAGVLVMAAGLWLFWRSHADLGGNWSDTLEIHAHHTLVTQGVYRHIRHPMYSASWLIMIAQALLLFNWIAGFGGIVAFGVMYFLRVPKEEQMMQDRFGEQYQRYMASTGRVIPKY